MQAQSDTKTCQLIFAFEQEPVRLGQRNLRKANVIAGAQLRRDGKIDSDHVRDFRVAADRLAIS
jgi:hypothetical protein